MDYFGFVERNVVEYIFLLCLCRLDAKKSFMKRADDVVLPFGIVVGVPETKANKDKCGDKR